MPEPPDRPDLVLARIEQSRLKSLYAGLFEELSAYLYKLDPVGINYGVNPDEYETEVGTILPRVLDAESAAEIVPILREEFWRWFGATGIETATYEDLAEGILGILERFRSPEPANEPPEQ